MERIGIYGGSFNPVHIGHLMIASYLVQWKIVDRVWLTLSPRNPLKDSDELIPDLKRLEMLKIACAGKPGIEICDIELSMPQPSYTIDTLRLLSKRYPNKDFKLVIGSDNWNVFNQWKAGEEILEDYGVIVYPRPGKEVRDKYVDGMDLVQSPAIDLSSTFIRKALQKGKNMDCFLPNGVYDFIIKDNLYRNE